MRDAWKDHRGLWAVCEYLYSRKEGGCEEGGWQYDRIEFSQLICLFVSEANAQDYVSLMYNEYEARTKKARTISHYGGNPYSDLGGDETVSSNYPEGYIPRGYCWGQRTRLMVEPQKSEVHYGYHNLNLVAPHYE